MSAEGLDGAGFGLAWALPFAGILLSIALFPLLTPRLWEHHFGKIACAWALAFVLPAALAFGATAAAAEVWRMLTLDFFPFIVLLFALFVVAGGIRITGNLVGTPATNTALLAFGTLSASLFGTIGASLLLIRPLIQANKHRQHNVHVFVFFIFLVGNIGGSLTPLGNPPLFLGFLKGVSFLWTLQTMLRPMLLTSGILLALFYVIDRLAWNKEHSEVKGKKGVPRQIRIEGAHNIIYLAVVVDTVLFSGLWERDVTVPVGFGIEMPLNDLVREFRVAVYQLPVMENDTAAHPRGECVYLDAVSGGGDPVRRHLHHHDPHIGDAARRSRGTLRAAAQPRHARRRHP